MKILTFSADNKFDLEQKVNDFLKPIKNEQIHDIKFCFPAAVPAYSATHYYAVVILKS